MCAAVFSLTVNNNICVRVKDFFLDPRHIEPEYTDGLYAKYGKCPVQNFWSEGRRCSNLLEFMFNNEFHPTAEIDKKTGKRLPFLDGSGANSIRNLGSMKTIWRQFEAERLSGIDPENWSVGQIEADFWNHYMKRFGEKFENSVKILQEYVAERRALMSEEDVVAEYEFHHGLADDWLWEQGSRDFLRHLIYRTPHGYILERVLAKTLCDCVGGQYLESNAEDERKGIDGYVQFNSLKAPFSLKPVTYYGGKVSPVDHRCFVTYDTKSVYPHLMFTVYGNGEIQKQIKKCMEEN